METVSLSEEYAILSADGKKQINIPVTVNPDQDPYYQLTDLASRKAYYEENGYVVVRGLLPDEVCDGVLQAFDAEVKHFPGHIYRQTSSLPEKHQLTEGGHILNSIKHIQDMDRTAFPGFIESAFGALTHERIRETVRGFLGEDSVVVQTMFFDGNPATPAHYDSYYLDSEAIGSMVAVWVALEDIHPGAGRFFVYPGSHKMDLPENRGEFEMAFHHERYLEEIQRIISEPSMECRAPALRKGDVLFWNAKLIHGSLLCTESQHSRKSLTAHFIPASRDYVLFQNVKMDLNLKRFNNYPVHCPKSPEVLSNRLQMFGLIHFPGLFGLVRKLIIKLRSQR